MITNLPEEYNLFIQTFVDNHFDLLSTQRKYDVDSDESSAYIPKYNETPDDNFIRNNPHFKLFVDAFIAKFIDLPELTLDLKGHFKKIDGKSISEAITLSKPRNSESYFILSLEILHSMFSFKLLGDVFSAYINKRDKINSPPRYFVVYGKKNTFHLGESMQCPSCSTLVTFIVDYDTKKVTPFSQTHPCKLAIESRSVGVTIPCNSKKLVFLNSPRKFFPMTSNKQHSLNSTLGCIEETKFYASHNIGYFFVGNTSVDIIQKDSKITALTFDDRDKKHIEKYKDYIQHGNIWCTLWWYTVLDYDLYLDLCAGTDVDPDSIEHIVVPIHGNKVNISHSLAAHRKGYHNGVFSQMKVSTSKK